MSTNERPDETDDGPIRPELAELRARLAATTDAARPAAVARRRKTNQRTARENITDLVDEGTFLEYGGLAVAAQRARMSLSELVAAVIDPADTRAWILRGLAAAGPPAEPRARRFIDTW